MPHAIFFTKRGHSIHGSDDPGLGTPVLRPSLAAKRPTLYHLVLANGMAQTKVVVRGPDPPGITVPSQPLPVGSNDEALPIGCANDPPIGDSRVGGGEQKNGHQ
jgi:hypothetical protein